MNKNIKEIIISKLNKITEEYNCILKNHKEDLDYINICSSQYNSMRTVLEEILDEIEEGGEING